MAINEEHIMKHAAFGYLSQWHQTDSDLMANIVLEKKLEKRGEAFSKLATKYQVIRTFPIKKIREAHGEKGVAKHWRKVATSVAKVQLDESDASTTADKVHTLALRLGRIFSAKDDPKENPSLISAATKFLWFAGHTSIRIYDKRAVEALNELSGSDPVNGDYAAYAKVWDEEFNARKQMVKTAIRGSIAHIDWSAIPDGAARTLAIKASKTEWFADRVFDKFLWILGAKEKDGALGPDEKVAQLKELIVHLAG